jgi:hypothetical protein
MAGTAPAQGRERVVVSSSVAAPDRRPRTRGPGAPAVLAVLACVAGLAACGLGIAMAQPLDAWHGIVDAPQVVPSSVAPAAALPDAQGVTADAAEPASDDIVTGAVGDARGPGAGPIAAPAAPAAPSPAPAGANAGRSPRQAPPRIGQPADYDAAVEAGSGAGTAGFDSLNRPRAATKPFPGTAVPAPSRPAAPPLRGNRVRVPVSASVAGTAAGQPARRLLKPDPDPFGAVGLYAGPFLAKMAVELSGGYDTNPGRFSSPRGSAFYLIAPELLVTSNWSRHELIADLRGSFTGYGTTFPPGSGTPGPTVLDRPGFTGRVTGRFDVTRDTRIIGEWRSRISTDNPGSPNIEAGLAEYPLLFSNGASVGIEQDFNRLRLAASATVDRTIYQHSKLTDGSLSSNSDRNVTQYGGIGRASYELRPGFRPFVEVEGDTRIHDSRTDRFGFLRDSSGGYIKVGSTFELTPLIVGEAAVGYLIRNYDDPRLNRIAGLLTSGSLVWTPSALTTVRLTATSSVDETTLPGSSGAVTRGYGVQVDHDFRRWLTGTLRFAYGTVDYDGVGRFDRTYSVGGDVVYRMSRTVHVKASVRHDWLESNIVVNNSQSTVMLLGVRLQR